MSQPVREDSTSNRNSWIKWLRINCSLSIPHFTSEDITSGSSDEPQMASGLVTCSTNSCIVSPSSFESVAPLVVHEDPHYEDDLHSSPTSQPRLKLDVDFKKYHDQPQNLSCYITRTDKYPCGQGGFSNVWKCKLHSFPRYDTNMPPQDVAVKAFRAPSSDSEDMKKLIKKLRQEVFVWQKLEHLHILPLYGIADDFGPIPALVCPWMENGTLQHYLEKMWQKQLSHKMYRLFLLLSQVASGLQYLHNEGIIHGDLTPLNILIDEKENALLADFGLSRLLGDHETSFFKSQGSGTIRWAAPEITPLDPETPGEEVSKPNKASDIYSFGCIMMRVLSGKCPYYNIVAESQVIVAKSRGDLPKRPPDIADVYWCYVERCLSPSDKRPSVDEVLEYIVAERDRQELPV